MPSPASISAADDLGADALELVRLVELDRERHEAAINEHQRTALTIRGLTLTAAAGLVAGGFASFVALPDYFAIVSTAVFLAADYYYSRLYTAVEKRIPILASLSTNYRRLLARSVRSQDSIDDFRGDLRAFSSGTVAPDPRPELWPIESLGRLKVFLPLYMALVVIAAVSAWYVESHQKPGTQIQLKPAAIMCVGHARRNPPATHGMPSVRIVPCGTALPPTTVP